MSFGHQEKACSTKTNLEELVHFLEILLSGQAVERVGDQSIMKIEEVRSMSVLGYGMKCGER
jgi:hypothetical protein